MLEKQLVRPVLIAVFKLLFRVEVTGMAFYREAGERQIIIANHQSFLDPLLLAVFLPDKPAFAMNVHQARRWYFRWLEKIVTLYKLDPAQPMSMKRLITDVRAGKRVVIFPEGRITTTGGIMKIYEGSGLIAQKTGAAILPIHIGGAQYSKLSLVKHKLRQRLFPKITLDIFPPRYAKEGERLSARAVYDIMTETAFEASEYRRPLISALLDAVHWHGGSHEIASDMSRDTMNYRQLLTRSFILSGKLKPRLGNLSYVGVMLPSSMGALVTFFALHMLNRVPCMLNFSSGEANILHACRIATAKTILTSRSFVEKGKLEPLVAALEKEHQVIYLEDIRPTVHMADKLFGVARALFPRLALARKQARIQPDDVAVVLYTSGSEGTPKGVALSHANILSNLCQACARLDLMPSDIVFNALPVFHSFGLTIGMLMPVLRGLRTFLYPSPLHYRVIPELVYDTNATIMLGTDTFFNLYAGTAHEYDFMSVRLAVAGAEKLRDSTYHMFADRFRLPIMQGYGVTEASPAISFNTPLEHKLGTVGRIFPGMKWKLEPVAGLERGGRLYIKGPNIMLGYLKSDHPGIIQPQGEWYDTGDIVDIGADGFVTILGRAKRFAKIAGEMLSLQAVEELAAALLPEQAHAAIAIPDERKGEQVILFTEAPSLDRLILSQHARNSGVAEIYLPKRIVFIEAIPRLGNGKIDYIALKEVPLPV